MLRFRAALLVVVFLTSALVGAPSGRAQVLPPGQPSRSRVHVPRALINRGVIQAIQIVGNERIEASTIRSYMLVQPGDPFDQGRIDRSVKTLYATGLFRDVSIARRGDTLVVSVKENPIVNRIAFEGNHLLTDKQLLDIVQLRARAVFTPEAAQADRQRILAAYTQKGRYGATIEPEIIRLSENRVDVIFKINDGPNTLISRIVFVGNHAFGEGRLASVINSRPERWWAILSSADQYSPEALAFDQELLRRFYLSQGYVDFRVVDAKAELAPDRKSFFLTFTLHEGGRYRVGKITINSQLKGITPKQLRPELKLASGDWYNGDAVGRSADAMETAVRRLGIAFVTVKPRIESHPETHVVDLVFDVSEGPRVYVERIDITGNTRTQDRVIRREFRIAEGDAYNSELVRRSRQRLQDLGYFSNVTITPTPGSAPDKTVLATTVGEKSTGELSLGGGFATDAGLLLDAGIREHNLVGTGIDAGLNGVLAQRESSIDLSVTDPYFLDRNLLVGGDLFLVQTFFLGTEPYDERREGFTARAGYDFNEHLRQVWSYSLVNRTVFNVNTTDFYVASEAGSTVLSQISQVMTLDERDSRIDPHSGYLVTLGTDFAGAGGNAQFIRPKIDGTYYVPLDRFTGNSDWGIAISAGSGYLFNFGVQESIIDRFYLGYDNLRGFQLGGAGPHAIPSGDSLGGRFIWTQSTELHFPLPVPSDIGISGRAFVDIGADSEGNFSSSFCLSHGGPKFGGNPCPPIFDSPAARVGIGAGVSWKTPFGLINIDITPFVVKQPWDQTQLIRFGFGTRF